MEIVNGMIRTHEIKIDSEYADSVYYGDKTFEVRRNDRGYQKGDRVKFKVVKEGLSEKNHPLNDRTYEITYVLGSFYGLADGYVAFSIREVKE